MPSSELVEWSVLHDVKALEEAQRGHDALHARKPG